MNMGVSSLESRSSFSIDSCRSMYSDGKAVLTTYQLGTLGEGKQDLLIVKRTLLTG